MAERPLEYQKWSDRNYSNQGPKVHIDYCNPQMGSDGSSVYGLYTVSDFGYSTTWGVSEAGRYNVHADQQIEICAGAKNGSDSPSIIISTPGGNINITTMNNGDVLINASKNIIFQADNDVVIHANNNVSIQAENKVQIDATIANCKALQGNLTPEKETFGYKALVDPKIYIGFDDIIGDFTGNFV